MHEDTWLHDIVLVNDTGRGDDIKPVHVDVFRSAGDLCRYLEPWWVEERHGLAFTAAGEAVIFGSDGRCVSVEGYEARPDGRQIVLSWLRHSAEAVGNIRRKGAAKGKICLGRAEAEGVLPTSIEGLIAYVGFVG
jgi:hypothetical protein